MTHTLARCVASYTLACVAAGAAWEVTVNGPTRYAVVPVLLFAAAVWVLRPRRRPAHA